MSRSKYLIDPTVKTYLGSRSIGCDGVKLSAGVGITVYAFVTETGVPTVSLHFIKGEEDLDLELDECLDWEILSEKVGVGLKYLRIGKGQFLKIHSDLVNMALSEALSIFGFLTFTLEGLDTVDVELQLGNLSSQVISGSFDIQKLLGFVEIIE